MVLDKIPMFSVVKKRINWLSQRQEILAQNIANSDTPEYRAKDISPFKFKELIRRHSRLNMAISDPAHHVGQRRAAGDFREVEDAVPYETSPSGNSVVLEEQMTKIGESGISHKLTTNLYKKHLAMFKMALGDGR